MKNTKLYKFLFEQEEKLDAGTDEQGEDFESMEDIELDPSIIPSTPSDNEMDVYLTTTFYKPASSDLSLIGEEVEADDGLDQVDDSDPGFMLIKL